MFEETGKSILDSLKQRFISPFSGALVISWLLWNIKIPLILLFDEPGVGIIGKFDLIRSKVYHDGNLWYITFFVYVLPIISAFLIVWVYPFLTNLAHAKSIKFKVEKHNKTVELEGKLTLTNDEFNEIKKLWDDKIVSLENELKLKKEQLLTLRDNSPTDVKSKIEVPVSSKKTEHPEAIITKKIIDKGYENSFENLLTQISKQAYISSSEIVDFCLMHGIIELNNTGQNDDVSAQYKLTTMGQLVKQYYVLHDSTY